MVQFKDRRRGNKQAAPPRPGGVPLSQYFAGDQAYKQVTRGELFSILAILKETEAQRRWYRRLWMLLTGKRALRNMWAEIIGVYRATKHFWDRQPKAVRYEVPPPEEKGS